MGNKEDFPDLVVQLGLVLWVQLERSDFEVGIWSKNNASIRTWNSPWQVFPEKMIYNWLVVEPYPSETYEFVSWEGWHPIYEMEK